MAALEYGMEDAPVMSTRTVQSVGEALGKAEGELRAYLQFHRLVLAPYNVQVRGVLGRAINADIKDAIYRLAVDAAVVRRQHPLVPLPPRSGPVFQPLAFKQLRALVEEGSTNSLVVRSEMWSCNRATPKGGGGGEVKDPPRRQRTDGDRREGRGGLRGAGGAGKTPPQAAARRPG